MIDLNLDPGTTQLRWFSALWFPLFLLAIYLFTVHGAAADAGTVAAILVPFLAIAIAGAIRPALIQPVWIVLMVLAFPIGWTVSIALSAAVFYLLITPIGLCLRLSGHDPLQLRKPSVAPDSYWVARIPVTDPTRYYRQF